MKNIIILILIIVIAIFAVIGISISLNEHNKHVYRMKYDPEYRLEHESIEHNGYRYQITPNHKLIIWKDFITFKTIVIYNAALKMPQSHVITKHNWKIIKEIEFTLDEDTK